MSADLPSKQCLRCQQWFPATVAAFYRRQRSPDQLDYWCKSCKTTATKQWLAAHPDHSRVTKAAWVQRHKERLRSQTRERMRRYRRDGTQTLKDKAWRQANPEKGRLYAQRWRQSHPEKVVAQRQRRTATGQGRLYAQHFRQRHPERHRAVTRRWQAAHRAQRNAYALAYRRAHPEIVRAQNQRARARRAGASLRALSTATWAFIVQVNGSRCVYCGRKLPRPHQDHLTPLSAGGSHTPGNVLPACRSCNSRKGTGSVLTSVQPVLPLQFK